MKDIIDEIEKHISFIQLEIHSHRMGLDGSWQVIDRHNKQIKELINEYQASHSDKKRPEDA